MRPHGAFILARYSTDNQNADSIEVQVGKCSEWCNAQSLPILGIYADYAVSGMKDTRPQYEAMMTALRAGQADTVVIYDQSRMFRLLTAWFEFRRELESMDVRVVSVTPSFPFLFHLVDYNFFFLKSAPFVAQSLIPFP